MPRQFPIFVLLWAWPALALCHPGVRPGEAFTFKFSVGPIESGRARMSIGRAITREGRRLVAVHGQAETSAWLALVARVDDDFQLTLDAGTLLPRSVLTVEHGFRERRISARLDGRAIELELQSKERSGHARRVLPRLARDPVSALFTLRAAPLELGDVLDFDVLDGATLWRCKLTVRARESLRLEADPPDAPPRPTLRIEGELVRITDTGRPTRLPRRHLVCWLSDDRDRVLLRSGVDSDLGRATLELTSYLPPATRHETVPDLQGVHLGP